MTAARSTGTGASTEAKPAEATAANAEKPQQQAGRNRNGRNNGDLCASASVLQRHGLNRSGANPVAARELRHYGLIVLTRQGGLHGPSLYALSWHAIDNCGGKLDCTPTYVAPGDWRTLREPFKRPPKKQNASTESVTDRDGIRRSEPKKAA